MATIRPLIAVTATQRPTTDWDGGVSLVQVRISAQYAEAIYRAGGYPLVAPTFTGHGPRYVSGRGWPEERPKGLLALKNAAESLMASFSGLLLTGGGDVLLTEEPDAPSDRAMDRDRDFWEAALFEAARRLNRPILGVCRGVQLINVCLGGSLWDDIPSEIPGAIPHRQKTQRHNVSHKVIFEPNSQIAAIYGRDDLMVNSGHHQAIKDLAPGLLVSGRSEDGVIEAVELSGEPLVIGAQWHPEALIGEDPVHMELFKALVKAASRVTPSKSHG
jgi:putative glutamine amidotransferase